MATIQPFRDLVSLREAMENLMERSVVAPTANGGNYRSVPFDLFETEHEYVIKAQLPAGYDPNGLDITWTNGDLTVRGAVAPLYSDEELRQNTWHYRSTWHGDFGFRASFNQPVEASQVSAEAREGILTLHLPKSEASRPRRIPVTTASSN
jgi:HSP20 family protein